MRFIFFVRSVFLRTTSIKIDNTYCNGDLCIIISLYLHQIKTGVGVGRRGIGRNNKERWNWSTCNTSPYSSLSYNITHGIDAMVGNVTRGKRWLYELDRIDFIK